MKRFFTALFACSSLIAFAQKKTANKTASQVTLAKKNATVVQLPDTRHDLILQAPVQTWDEALPLGNGLMGGLLWGENNVIRLSLDRGDLWDERSYNGKDWWKELTYAKGVELVAQKKYKELNNGWDAPYWGVTPTKLPAGRLEIKLPVEHIVQQFRLNEAMAEGEARFNSKADLKVIYSATQPVALISIKGAVPEAVQLLSTMDVYRNSLKGDAVPASGGSVDKLGYPEAERGGKQGTQWYIQTAAKGFKYCVFVQTEKRNDETLIAFTITSTNDDADFLKLAAERCSKAFKQGYAPLFQQHTQWWRNFWQQSSVSVPDTAIQKQYNLVQYFYGAASRANTPPMPLQGVWTADNGTLPPWKGDYHNDLNTQMTYLAYQEAGRFDEGLSYLNYLWKRKPFFEQFAREFYGTRGLACPGVMSYAGQPLAGWGQYSLSPTMSAWSAHLFYLHWVYTGDDKFLKEKAYPWSAGVGECMMGLLKPDEKGLLKLPLSSSPEIFDNSPEAWLTPNSNYDLMCLKMLFLSLKEMAGVLQRPAESQKWETAAKSLEDFHTKTDGTLLVDAVHELPNSHRHLSNIIGLYPFNLITTEGGKKDTDMIRSSLKQWDSLGTSKWCGYSFAWMSCLQARVGNAEQAIRNLDIFVKAFILRNGFHVNGDQTKSGYSSFTYRPFTLEGNFLASQAVQEMLLQSWSSQPGTEHTGIIRVFPAVPDKWQSASFSNLRAEGGYLVSAKRENGKTSLLEITASKTGIVRVKNNFGSTPKWNLPKVQLNGDIYSVELKKGQTLIAQF
ncbi:glycoside hydrolase N-terminal domain-containing protein [Chitinophagaceae bacterium 26-R-25]|nr:glycoside hydrolase N-terminal domain-containing protein [Chitinophagaceae bacterium 26-R-25]